MLPRNCEFTAIFKDCDWWGWHILSSPAFASLSHLLIVPLLFCYSTHSARAQGSLYLWAPRPRGPAPSSLVEAGFWCRRD